MEVNVIKKDSLYFELALLMIIPMLNISVNIQNLLLLITYSMLIANTYKKIKNNKEDKLPIINIVISLIGIAFIFMTFIYYGYSIFN